MNSPLPTMIGYGLGECAYSLVMNGLFNFAMLYYTEALGLSPALAGLALSASVLWEVVWCLGCAMFLMAPLLNAFALVAVTRYPLSRRRLEEQERQGV